MQRARRLDASLWERTVTSPSRPAAFETGPAALQLQRSAGNQAVARLVQNQPVVQRTVRNFMILKTLPMMPADGTCDTEGRKDSKISNTGAGDFIVNGKKGTWHHIYPRNLLRTHVQNISRYLAATKNQTRAMTATSLSCRKAMTDMAASFSMGPDGVLNQPAHYYWKHGNGYVGVRSDFRTDDPGPLVEHKKPRSMSSDRYEKPRLWGKELEKLSIAIGQLSSLSGETEAPAAEANLERMALNIMNMSWELDGAPYRSVAVENKDWKKDRPGTPPQWGDAVKNYRLVE